MPDLPEPSSLLHSSMTPNSQINTVYLSNMLSDFVKQLQVSLNGWERSTWYIWYYFKLWIYTQEFNGLHKKYKILPYRFVLSLKGPILCIYQYSYQFSNYTTRLQPVNNHLLCWSHFLQIVC